MRKVPFKNYIKLTVLISLTIVITLGTALIYQNYKNNIKSYVSKNIQNINGKELNFYFQENDYVIAYVGSSSDNSHDDEASKLVEELKNKEFIQYMVFIDKDNKDNAKYIKDKFNLSFGGDYVMLIEDGKLINYVRLSNYNIYEFMQLLKGDFDD